jgi:hypothetical protein
VKRDSWQRTVNTKTKWKRGQGVLVGAWGEKQHSNLRMATSDSKATGASGSARVTVLLMAVRDRAFVPVA